jgi:hypothetical protein
MAAANPAPPSAPMPDVAPPAPLVNGRREPAVGRRVDRDALTQAWGDGVLRNLPARAKALFSAGRFVAADEEGARFALPNAAHRDRCAELAPQVEAALTAHFGAPVSLVLVVDDGTGALAPRGLPASRAELSGPLPGEFEELGEEDPADLMAASVEGPDQASAAEARLREAFPGLSEESE